MKLISPIFHDFPQVTIHEGLLGQIATADMG